MAAAAPGPRRAGAGERARTRRGGRRAAGGQPARRAADGRRGAGADRRRRVPAARRAAAGARRGDPAGDRAARARRRPYRRRRGRRARRVRRGPRRRGRRRHPAAVRRRHDPGRRVAARPPLPGGRQPGALRRIERRQRDLPCRPLRVRQHPPGRRRGAGAGAAAPPRRDARPPLRRIGPAERGHQQPRQPHRHHRRSARLRRLPRTDRPRARGRADARQLLSARRAFPAGAAPGRRRAAGAHPGGGRRRRQPVLRRRGAGSRAAVRRRGIAAGQPGGRAGGGRRGARAPPGRGARVHLRRAPDAPGRGGGDRVRRIARCARAGAGVRRAEPGRDRQLRGPGLPALPQRHPGRAAMALSHARSVPILYDLAMAMAGETRPRPLATAVLQRLLSHTGSACGALLLHAASATGATSVTAEVHVAIGNPALRAMEGKSLDWPASVLSGDGAATGQGGFPDAEKYRHTLAFALPELGHLLLFFRQAPEGAAQLQRLFAPILARFARSLRHDIESEATAQALQQSELRYRSMLESTSDWVWEVDTHGVFTFASNKVRDLLGYAPEEVVGKTPFDFMPPAEARHVGWAFRDITVNRWPFSGLENVNLHRDGREVVLETSGVPIFDAAGNYRGYRGIDRDITARRQEQDALLRAKEAAEASSHAKSLFLSSISHELRTPLNAILGHAQLLAMQEGMPEPASISAEEIMQAGNSLLLLVNCVIELAEIESGGVEMQTEALAVSGVMDDCLAHNATAARVRRIPLDCAVSCDRCLVMADRHALLQVLNHLVANAIKYNHDGGQVSLGCRALDNGRIRLSVTDTGPGIAPADRAHLFVPFDRLGAEKGQISGAGIGLAISQRLVEAMSGSIGVDSPPGGGSTFWVELPAAATGTACAGCTPAPALRKGGLAGARVLVAEDYVPNQTILQLQLTTLGCQADLADDGAAALEKWRAGGHDLILADLNMPVMGGLALARAVRAHEADSGRHTPIVCITAADHADELAQCREAGIDDVLAKPIALDALRGKLARWLGEAASDAAAPQASGDAVLDLDCLYQVLGEVNVEQGRALVATFLRTAAEGLQQLASAPAGAAVAREMHKQKSSARTVGALRYAALAGALEQAAKQDHGAGLAAPLAELREALGEVEAAYAGLRADAGRAALQPLPLAGHGALLVVDDDPVVLQQMAAMLATLGVAEVLTASNGMDALRLLNERNGSVEALVCDLNMPGMDGVELIRLFGRSGYRGGLVLMSGADEKVLSTVGKLADLQGLRVLGQVQKPVTPEQMTGLLSRRGKPRPRKRPASAPLEASPQAIRDGIARDEFTVWFQPKVDAGTLMPVGVEALARWQHPLHGILSPDVFIGVAEREGLVGELSQILASKALMEGARLHEAGFRLSIAVNLSGLWLDDLQLPDFMLATTQAAGLRPADLILEVTETGVMKELTTALDVLTRLRLKGFGLSIDDFGIGYSSFEQLDRIPFTELKLDRSFVHKGSTDATARAILQGSMDMARRMALATVAEGVETDADLELVRAMGCDRVQGYLIAAPMPTAELIAWLRAGRDA